MKLFDHFLSKPIEYWFPDDPFEHWQNKPEGHNVGWESFLSKVVRDDKATKSGVTWKFLIGRKGFTTTKR